jgi:addiction module HigA family antidote
VGKGSAFEMKEQTMCNKGVRMCPQNDSLFAIFVNNKKIATFAANNNKYMKIEIGVPFRPVHPGELLKDELEYRHLSQKMVAQQLEIPYTAFNEILNGKRPVTTDFALLMEAALGVPAYILIGMQTDYNLQVAKDDARLNQRLNKVRKLAASFL